MCVTVPDRIEVSTTLFTSLLITRLDYLFGRWWLRFPSVTPWHYGTKLGHSETSKIHFPEGVSEVSERANERTDERVAQYLRLYSCLFQTTVGRSSD